MSASRPKIPVRSIPSEGLPGPQPRYVVWEITLSCNLKCRHCGSRAGEPRTNELTTEECLGLIGALREAGTKEIVLIGGEAYLRPDWLELIREIDRQGIQCGLQTGARALSEAKIRAAAEAGLRTVGVSIDGVAATHDALRGVKGNHAHAVAAIGHARRHGLMATANTQINRRNVGELRQILDTIATAGAMAWQVQLTVPMGRAADDAALILQPHEIGSLMPELFSLFQLGLAQGLQLIPGNNIGYFGPYEAAWRSTSGRSEYYGGCQAGRAGAGIESDGTIKACPSLPTSPYAGGNVREKSFSEIWGTSSEVSFMRNRDEARGRLWGFCAKCYYGPVCRAGCSWTTHVLTGRPGNNPFCHYRVRRLLQRGWREIIVQRKPPEERRPFDYGCFEILVEDENGHLHGQDIYSGPEFSDLDPSAASPSAALVLCEICDQFFYEGEPHCPHCRSPASATRPPANDLERSLQAARRVQRHLEEADKILQRIFERSNESCC